MVLVVGAVGRAVRGIHRSEMPTSSFARSSFVNVQPVLAGGQAIQRAFDGDRLAGLLEPQCSVHAVATDWCDVDFGMRGRLLVLLREPVCGKQDEGCKQTALRERSRCIHTLAP